MDQIGTEMNRMGHNVKVLIQNTMVDDEYDQKGLEQNG